MTSPTRNRLRARVGAVLIAGSMGAAVLAVPGGGLAQEEPAPTPVTVEKDAVFAKPAGAAAPNTVTSEFPPGLICLVIPQFCNEDAQQITGPINDGLTQADPENTRDDQSPQQFRAPNTITVGQNSGEDRYAGGLLFATPAVPEGQEVVSATLILHETDPTYHTSSPFFRQVMLAALASYRDREGGAEELEKAVMNEGGQYPPESREVGDVGVEVCPFTEAFTEGTNQWADTPGFDCIFGANGVRVETADGWDWHFDLGFTVQAWMDGTLANNGLYVRPTKAPNLAFGDPDTSWQAQISFGSAGHSAPPELAMATAEVSSPAPFVPPPASNNQPPPTDTGSTSNSGSFFPAPQAFPAATSGGGSAPVAEPGPVVAPAPQQQPAPVAAPARAIATTPWWVWLLVPTFLIGMFMVSQSLTAEMSGAAVATAREGAMTRLIRQRNAGELATSTPQFQV